MTPSPDTPLGRVRRFIELWQQHWPDSERIIAAGFAEGVRGELLAADLAAVVQAARLPSRSAPRIFTARTGPPVGQAFLMTDGHGHKVAWTGKGWYYPDAGQHPPQAREFWPPDGRGPWIEAW